MRGPGKSVVGGLLLVGGLLCPGIAAVAGVSEKLLAGSFIVAMFLILAGLAMVFTEAMRKG